MSVLKQHLCLDRKATGGILTIFTSFLLILILNICIVWLNLTTSRAIAEQAERVVSLQCLSSNYINNKENFGSYIMGVNSTFPAITKNGYPINPVEQFNQILSGFDISGHAINNMKVEYKKDGNKYICTVQAESFKMDNILNSIQPDPVQTVIEDR